MKKSNTPITEAVVFDQLELIASAVGKTLAPFCEVVIHDLTNPKHAIVAIHNNLSGRKVGDPVTELGLARMADENYPQVIANYANQFKDGRKVKSTSIGIKNGSGKYVAALCLNIDLSFFQGLQSAISQFVEIDVANQVKETLDPVGSDAIRARIDQFAASLATTPRALRTTQRRALLQEIKSEGLLDVRRAMDTVAAYLGVSRASVYSYVKSN
jgi:predicted transcriptional regulator YheO